MTAKLADLIDRVEREAVYLAHEIEWMHAKDRAGLIPRRRGSPSRQQMAASEFDPHAATELANLIAHRFARALQDQTDGR